MTIDIILPVYEEEEGLPGIPTQAAQWGAIRAVVVDTRKDGENEVCQCKNGEDDRENDSDRFVDREKECY